MATKEQLREFAYDEYIRMGFIPGAGLDRRPQSVPGADNTGRKTLAEYTKLTMAAFKLQACAGCGIITNAKYCLCGG